MSIAPDKVHPFIAGLPQVNSPKAYGDWIWNSFAKLYTDPHTSDFNSIQLYLQNRQITHGRGLESALDVMEVVYIENVPAQNQPSYRKGIGLNFERCVCTPSDIIGDILSDHIYLAGGIKASEALEGLAKVLLSPVLTTHPHILYESISTGVAIRNKDSGDSRDERVYEFARKLLDVPSVKDGTFFFPTLRLMLDSDPGARVQTLEKYGPRLTSIAATYKTPKGAPKFNGALKELSKRFPDVKEIISSYQIK